MEDRIDSYIEKLSKGMRQRVGLAQALLNEPRTRRLQYRPFLGERRRPRRRLYLCLLCAVLMVL